MLPLEAGEPFAVVATEEEMDALVSVEAEELSYDLDGENLRVGVLGGGAALGDTASLSRSSTKQKMAMMQVLRSMRGAPFLSSMVWSANEGKEVSSLARAFGGTCTRG